MRPEVRDAINNINRMIQETKFINVSDNTDNIVKRTLGNLDEATRNEVWEHLQLIIKEISKVHNAGTENEFLEKYYYLSEKEYTDMDEFKSDFMIFD